MNEIESAYHTKMAEIMEKGAFFCNGEIVLLCRELDSVIYLFKKIKCSHLCRNLSQDWESLKNTISLFSIIWWGEFSLICIVEYTCIYKAEENLFSTQQEVNI